MSTLSIGPSLVDGSENLGLENSIQRRLLPKKKSDKYSSAYIPHNRLSRYTKAVANLIPVRLKQIAGSEIPVDKIGLFSSVTFSWLNEYISSSWKNELKNKGMPIIASPESCQVNGPRIDGLWHSHIVKRGQAGASVPRIAWRFVKTRVLVASLIHFLGTIIALCNPILILPPIIFAIEDSVRIKFIQNRINDSTILSLNLENIWENKTTRSFNESINDSHNESKTTVINDVTIYFYVGILIFIELLSYFMIAWSAALNLRTATRLRAACIALAYKKLIRCSITYEASVHEILSYFIPDSKTLYELISNGPRIFSGPVILLFFSIFIWYTMSHWVIIGIIALITLCLALIFGSYLTNIFSTKLMKYSLKRLHLLEEFIEKIYPAKVTQWDKHFIELIRSLKNKEFDEMKFLGMNEGWNVCMIHIIPIVTVTTTIIAYIFIHKQIVFTNYISCLILLLLNVKNCVRDSYHAMNSIFRGMNSLNNFKIVLILNDTERYTDKPIDKNLAIAINNGQFSWNMKQLPGSTSVHSLDVRSIFHSGNQILHSPALYQLMNIYFYAPKGSLIGICGRSGSGKTSFLLSLMGQLNYIKGHISIDGTLSYVPEISCLFEGTVKENIIMGDIFDPSLYYKTIQACNLNDEISQLPGGDDTDISIFNLSNVQKQKISLARAIYSNRDINLLDNPLKDVDMHEMMDIFEKSICQILREHTVIIATDQIHLLRKCDTIYVMNDGKIIEQGKHEDLIYINENYTDLINSVEKKYQQNMIELSSDSSRIRDLMNSNVSASNFQMINEVDTKTDVYVLHNKSNIASQFDYHFSSNNDKKYLNKFVSIISILYSLPIAVAPLIFFYIIQKTVMDLMQMTIILTFLVVFIILLGIILTAIYTKYTFKTAKYFHERWLQQIYRAHISAFNMISTSILLNIFSIELQKVEYVLPKLKMKISIHIGISVFSALTLAFLSSWLIIPAAIFIFSALFYIIYVKKLLTTLDELSIDSIISIYNHTVHTVNNRVIIQAYRKEGEFAKKYYKYCNSNVTCDFMFKASKLWIECRIKLLSIVTLGVVMIICTIVNGINDRYQVLGLAFIFTLQMIQSVSLLIEFLIDATQNERTINLADNYMENIPREIGTDDDHCTGWPSMPNIYFQDVLFTNHSTYYEPWNFSIYAGENVVIQGINKEMKQNFINALLRMEELYSGNIQLDGINIADIHIDTLRQYLNYIPSIPILFDGSIRYNLEPNNRKTNNEIMAVLQKFFLWDKIAKLDDKLTTNVKQAAFSITEKKLLCLARIYLNTDCFNRNIIILGSIDCDTDVIGNVLQNMFKEFTIIVLSNEMNWNIQRIVQLPNEKSN